MPAFFKAEDTQEDAPEEGPQDAEQDGAKETTTVAAEPAEALAA